MNTTACLKKERKTDSKPSLELAALHIFPVSAKLLMLSSKKHSPTDKSNCIPMGMGKKNCPLWASSLWHSNAWVEQGQSELLTLSKRGHHPRPMSLICPGQTVSVLEHWKAPYDLWPGQVYNCRALKLRRANSPSWSEALHMPDLLPTGWEFKFNSAKGKPTDLM